MDRENIFESFIVNKYIAHRGLHNDIFPENSLGAFKNAIDNGYAIELDVHLLSDGTVAVFHDTKLARMTGKDGYIKNLKLDDLKEHKLLGTEYCIPTLKEVLDFVDGRTGIMIEIKNKTGRVGQLEKEVCKLIKNYKGDVAVISFNPISLEWFSKYSPNVLRGQLSYFYNDEDAKKISFIKRFILKRMLFNSRSKPDFISYSISDLPNRYVKKYKDLPLLGWVVRSQEQYMETAGFVDNIVFEGFNPKI